MALAFSNQRPNKPHKGIRSGQVDITLDDSYAAGGWAIAAADLNLTTIRNIYPPAASITGFVLAWDHVNGKLMAFEEADGATAMQEIDATDLDAAVIRCRYEGV